MKDELKVALPYRGEFGFVCMFHAPQVRALKQPKVAYIEEGNEALYPGCCHYRYVERRADEDRRARTEKSLLREYEQKARREFGDSCRIVLPNQDASREYFVPRPYKLPAKHAQFLFHRRTRPEVVLCPRKREYGSDKNWPCWDFVAESLRSTGVRSFSVGHPESSYSMEGFPSAWTPDEGRYLDVTIAAMNQADVVVATDNGLAHLAMMCGKPVFMVSYKNGLVSPGTDDVGKPYWPIKRHRYDRENHRDAPFEIVPHSWRNPHKIVQAVLGFLGGTSS